MQKDQVICPGGKTKVHIDQPDGREETRTTSIDNRKPSVEWPKWLQEDSTNAKKMSSQPNPAKKHRRLQQHNEEKNQGDSVENLQLVVILEKTIVVIQGKTLALSKNTEKGQASRISKNEVLTFKDLPAESYELGTIL